MRFADLTGGSSDEDDEPRNGGLQRVAGSALRRHVRPGVVVVDPAKRFAAAGR